MAAGGEETCPLIEHTNDKTDDNETFNLPPPDRASTPKNTSETFEMQTLHEQSGVPDTSYQETNLGGTPSTEEIERRLNALRDKNTGLLDMSKIALQNILLSEDDKQKEIQRVKSQNVTTTPI